MKIKEVKDLVEDLEGISRREVIQDLASVFNIKESEASEMMDKPIISTEGSLQVLTLTVKELMEIVAMTPLMFGDSPNSASLRHSFYNALQELSNFRNNLILMHKDEFGLDPEKIKLKPH
jgi:hypothetical protein